jgi:hypothetical protein
MHFVISGTWGPTDPTRAEREACPRAYLKSQAHEGWRLVPGY